MTVPLAGLREKMSPLVLNEDIDPDYEPTPEEIQEYAEWLGMKSPEDDDLRWIAREGLKAPLPEHWKPCKTNDGEVSISRHTYSRICPCRSPLPSPSL